MEKFRACLSKERKREDEKQDGPMRKEDEPHSDKVNGVQKYGEKLLLLPHFDQFSDWQTWRRLLETVLRPEEKP
jgi:hypothetical protein